MKRRSIIFLLILCISLLTLAACAGGYGPDDSLLGHRFGNPEITFADGTVYITHMCVDCDYQEVEVREISTQVADESIWNAAFQNLSMAICSAKICATYEDEVQMLQGIVTEDRAYLRESIVEAGADPAFWEYYALQKDEETYIEYRLDGETGEVSVTPDSSDFLLGSIKRDVQIYVSFEGLFDQFTYDAESGAYVSTNLLDIQLLDATGVSLGVKKVQTASVNIADGQIICFSLSYEETNEYLETICFDLHFYNIGYSVVKVPQSVIEKATDSVKTKIPPMEFLFFEIQNGEIIITGRKTGDIVDITIPATWSGYPVVEIAAEAFDKCENLTRIVIPDSIVRIGENAFNRCNGLVDVIYEGTQAQWNEIAISEIGNEWLLNAPIQYQAYCDHSYGDGVVTKQPTCGAMGIKTYTCADCGDTKIEYLAKHADHSYNGGIVTEEPTCTEAGVRTYTCSVCGKNKIEYIPKLTTHNYTNGTCTVCGADDPQYAPQTEKDGGIWSSVIKLVEAIFEIVFFFL